MTAKTNIKCSAIGLRNLTIAVFLIAFNFACTEDSTDPGMIEYTLKNTSEVDVGFKIHLLPDANASIVKDSVIIKPGEDLVIIKSHVSQAPELIIDEIEIWNSEFKSKYKKVNIQEYSQVNDRYTLTIGLPYKATSEITGFYTSVHFYLDQTSLFGFYPKVAYPRTTYFFRTSNYFQEVFKTQIPTGTPNSEFKIVDIFGSTIIGYDAAVYSDKILFIKSNDNGLTWKTLFEFGFSTSDDAFTATDFINESTGWLCNYKIVFNGQFANTYATDIYKYSSGNLTRISTIHNYSVYRCKFIDENVGYALVNTSNNTVPADRQETLFIKTSDGGVTWSAPTTVSENNSASNLFRLDNGTLITFFNSSHPLLKQYLVSTDDGQTWQSQNISSADGIRDLFFLANGTGYLKTGTTGLWSSENIGDVYKTTNGGATWTMTKEAINGSFIWFYDENIGYLQDLIYGRGQILYITKDGGITWNEVLYPYDYIIE